MNETLQKAEDYLRRAEQGFYTEIGEGDSLLKTLVEKVKSFFSQDEKSLPPAETPIPSVGDDAATPPVPEAGTGTESPAGEIPAEASPAPETTSAPDEAPKS